MTDPSPMDQLRDYATDYNAAIGLDHRDIDRRSFYSVRAFLDYVEQQERRRPTHSRLPVPAPDTNVVE